MVKGSDSGAGSKKSGTSHMTFDVNHVVITLWVFDKSNIKFEV